MYHIQPNLYDWRIVIKPVSGWVLVATVLHYLFPFMHGIETGEEGSILFEMFSVDMSHLLVVFFKSCKMTCCLSWEVSIYGRSSMLPSVETLRKVMD